MAIDSFERNLANRIDRNKRLSDEAAAETGMLKAHDRAEKLFKEHAIDPNSFRDLYDATAVDNDLERVRQLKREFVTNETKIAADILEAITFEHIELSNWFGPYAQTLKTSEYDDYVNGIDLVVEFDEPERSTSHLALGIDATYGTQGIHKKLDRIRRDIDQGHLSRIKYFESSNGSFKGQLSQVPRVILGVERDAVLSLAHLWNEGKNKELGEHPIKGLLRAQTRSQLIAFKHYAEKRHQGAIAEAFKNALVTFNTVPSSHEMAQESNKMFANDRVHQTLMRELELFD